MEAKLIVVGGKASKGAVALKLPTVIGRGREAGLTIAHPMISRRHCELFESDGLLMVRDLDSLNGTSVGGRRIKEAPLPPEGEFTIGPLTFRAQYEYAGDLNSLPETVLAEPAAPPPEQREPWTDSPAPAEAGAPAAFDPLTESTPPIDEPAVEVSFFEELQLEQPAAEPPAAKSEHPTIKREEPPKPPATPPAAPPSIPSSKPAAAAQKPKGIASMLQGALKKKGGKAAKPSGKPAAVQPPPEKSPPSTEPPKPAQDEEFPFAIEPSGESPSSKGASSKPGDEDFDIDSFLDGLK